MYCSACGNELQEGSAFCSSCGAKVGAQQHSNNAQDVQANNQSYAPPGYNAPPGYSAPPGSDKMIELGFIEPNKPKRLFSIRNWARNDIINDNIYSIEPNVDNIELAPGSYLHVSAINGGSFILGEGAILVAPNLQKCNSIILRAGARAWVPNLLRTEEGWFAGSDINRNGTVLVERGSLIYAPRAVFKYWAGDGQFITQL